MRWILVLACSALPAVEPLLACSIVSTPHEIEAHERLIDRTPPERVEASVTRIDRGRGPVVHPDGTVSGTSCDDLGSITVHLAFVPKDDRTSADEIGYRIVHVAGTLPEKFLLSEAPTRDLSRRNELFFYWVDGATNEQEPIEFALAVIAVDRGGNESAPSNPIWVRHPGSERGPAGQLVGGCGPELTKEEHGASSPAHHTTDVT